MLQISNYVFCDEIFQDLEIENKILPNPYRDYPFLVIKNFLSKKLMSNIASSIQKSDDVDKAEVMTQTNKGIVDSTVKEKYRKTNIYELQQKFLKLYEKRFLKYKPEFENYFNIALTQSTNIQVLEYKKDFFYMKHADDSSEIIDKNGKTIGFHTIAPQRKLTTVLFATSHDKEKQDQFHFSGGELLFNYLFNKDGHTIKFEPKAGDMLVFPSNPYFSHEVLKVQQGYRLTLVQWHDAIIL